MADYRIFYRTEKSKELDHEVNQDRMLFAENSLMNDEKLKIMLVADGMGGLQNGEKASYHGTEGFMRDLWESLLKIYMENNREGFSMTHHIERIREIAKQAVLEANREVCRHAEVFEETGTTLSAVLILGTCGVIVNVGDSPVYYYSSREEELTLVSTLQTKAEQDVQRGRYPRFSKEYYENDHILYRCLGQRQELAKSDICVSVLERLEKGDMILAGSDGAFGKMREPEILEIIADEKEYTVLKNLFERAREDKDDDQTAILYKVCGEV